MIKVCSGIFIIFLLSFVQGQSQDIPIGGWRLHISYDEIIDVDFSGETVYAAAEMGVAIFDQEDGSFSSLTKLNGLTGSGITAIGADNEREQLIITYEDSNIDLVTPDGVINYSVLRDVTSITGSKKVNDVYVHHSLAYLSTDYGVVVFDLAAKEVKETWRDLGPLGAEAKIFNASIFGDSIAISTDQGVLIGNLNDNLLDYNFWKRFDADEFSNGTSFVQWLDGTLYAAITETGVFQRIGNGFDLLASYGTNEFMSFESDANSLIFSISDKVVIYTPGDGFTEITDANITTPRIAKRSGNILWIGDSNNGIVTNITGVFSPLKPNGPSLGNNFRLRYANGKIYALSGGFSEDGLPLDHEPLLNIFENGTWDSETLTFNDLTDVTTLYNNRYVSSFSGGLIQFKPDGTLVVYDESNSPLLANETTGEISIAALEPTTEGVWVANYNTSSPLHFLKYDNTWTSYTPSLNQARYLTDLSVDLFGNVWGAVLPSEGGGLIFFNPETGETKRFTETTGAGALPNRSVLSVATDREGYVWVGTSLGVGYFFSESADAVRPIFESRFLLKDESINKIVVDGGNRKWMATNRGVWLFNPTGEELVYNFNTTNSPLLSDVVKDITIDEQSGEVFFATDKGIASFRSDATTGGETFATIKIFPNPVTAKFNGRVGITGLATDAVVKITDVSGKLLWQGVANGGTATWNVMDYNGSRAKTGIYLVFAATADGGDSAVGKIVIID
jgi:hypothetical protein